MKSADMIIKRIEEAGQAHFEPRMKYAFMYGMAEGEIRSLVFRLNQFCNSKADHIIHFNGVELGVNGYHQPEERMTFESVGTPEEFQVEQVFHRGEEISSLFTDDQISEIASLVLEQMRIAAEINRAEYAESMHQFGSQL